MVCKRLCTILLTVLVLLETPLQADKENSYWYPVLCAASFITGFVSAYAIFSFTKRTITSRRRRVEFALPNAHHEKSAETHIEHPTEEKWFTFSEDFDHVHQGSAITADIKQGPTNKVVIRAATKDLAIIKPVIKEDTLYLDRDTVKETDSQIIVEVYSINPILALTMCGHNSVTYLDASKSQTFQLGLQKWNTAKITNLNTSHLGITADQGSVANVQGETITFCPQKKNDSAIIDTHSLRVHKYQTPRSEGQLGSSLTSPRFAQPRRLSQALGVIKEHDEKSDDLESELVSDKNRRLSVDTNASGSPKPKFFD
jgi:hypothetical protein